MPHSLQLRDIQDGDLPIFFAFEQDPAAILVDGEVAGYLARFEMFDQPSIAYWLGRDYWGCGIATAALAAFLKIVTIRPLYARAVKDNLGSIRVLEKNGFVIVGEDKGYANGRGAEVEEVILRLD